MDLTLLELNFYKSDQAGISHIIHMIEVDNFWLKKTFEAVDLQRKEILEQENETFQCTENEKTHEELDEKEVIDLYSESQTTTSELFKGEESRK